MLSKTLFVTHPACLGHEMQAGHFESPERLRAIVSKLEASGAMARMERVEAPACLDEKVIGRAHDLALWRRIVSAAPGSGRSAVSPEAIMSPGTLDAISRGVGGAVEAVERVCSGRNPNAFVAVRPPGHHATRSEAMGFCFVNNAAIGALHALGALGLSRVAIVDIDVHHGNGTEDIVASDPRLFMASTFGLGIYPGNGERPLGENMANVGLAPGAGGAQMRARVLSEVIPALDAFAPQLVVVSAGYDAHLDDPLGNQGWDESDYAWWFHELKGVAARHAQGRLVAVLEGGYDVDALARSVRASVEELMA